MRYWASRDGGYEVIAQLRKKMSPMHRMIALTGYGQSEDRARSIAAGFDPHLVKPVDNKLWPWKRVTLLELTDGTA
jgi:CheY-like chemotaxis protein